MMKAFLSVAVLWIPLTAGCASVASPREKPYAEQAWVRVEGVLEGASAELPVGAPHGHIKGIQFGFVLDNSNEWPLTYVLAFRRSRAIYDGIQKHLAVSFDTLGPDARVPEPIMKTYGWPARPDFNVWPFDASEAHELATVLEKMLLHRPWEWLRQEVIRVDGRPALLVSLEIMYGKDRVVEDIVAVPQPDGTIDLIVASYGYFRSEETLAEWRRVAMRVVDSVEWGDGDRLEAARER